MRDWLRRQMENDPAFPYYVGALLLLIAPAILQVVYYMVWVMK